MTMCSISLGSIAGNMRLNLSTFVTYAVFVCESKVNWLLGSALYTSGVGSGYFLRSCA